MLVISLALLTLPAANGEKKIFLQFGNPAFITDLIYNTGFCLQYLDSLFIIYQSTHARCQTISSLMTERCPDKCSYWVKNISLLSIVTKGIRYSRHTGGVLEDHLCLQSGNLPHLLLPQPTGIPSQMVPGERPLTSLHCLLLKRNVCYNFRLCFPLTGFPATSFPAHIFC